MKRIFFVLLVISLQVFLIAKGASYVNKLVIPFLFLFVSASVAYFYFSSLLQAGPERQTITGQYNFKQRLPGFFIGLACIVVLSIKFSHIFKLYADEGLSDVIIQLKTLYERFSTGKQPYYPLEQLPWHPFPVYMPMHWLPLALPYALYIDVRWVGVFFLAFACGIWGYYTWQVKSFLPKLIACCLPAIITYLFMRWLAFDMAVSFDVIIAAYYLLLCAGLASGSLPLMVAGLICCLLSRYTLVFWLPLFFITGWAALSKGKNLRIWIAICGAVLLLYVFPFYLRDPGIFASGLSYHNHCYVDAWNGLGHPDQSTAFDEGLTFSYFVCHAFKDDVSYEWRVTVARIIQASVMILLTIGGLLLYKKWKDRISFGHFSLGMLYCFILMFFMFSPVTYRYYYFPFMIISGVLCGKTILEKKN